MKGHLQLGMILRRYGIISEDELEQALAYQQRHHLRIGEALLALGFCTEVHISRAVADQLGFPFVDLTHKRPDREALRLLPRGIAQKYGVVPVEKMNGSLVVVARNPLDFTMDVALRQSCGIPVRIVCGVESQIDAVLKNYDQLLINTPDAPNSAHLPGLDERLGQRREMRELASYSNGSNRSGEINRAINQLVEAGAEEIQLVLRQNTLKVTGSVEGQRRCVAFASGDEFQIAIQTSQGDLLDPSDGEAPFQVTLAAS